MLQFSVKILVIILYRALDFEILFFVVNLNQLSEQTRAEVWRRVTRMAENGNNAEEMIEQNGVANQITPIETI